MVCTKSFALLGLLAFLALNCEASETAQSAAKKNIKTATTTIVHKENTKSVSKHAQEDSLFDLSRKLDDFLELNSNCLNGKAEAKASVCIVRDLEKLAAEKNNYIAQHMLGNVYEKRSNFSLSLQWYELALANAQVPNFYKAQIQADYERVRLKVF